MKTVHILSLGLVIGFSTQAAMVRFQLSPPGTDFAVGLSPKNEVPPPTNSTGSGGEISSGIIFDTDTSILHVAVGYGSAAGFSNLTGAATAMHIHGPANTNQSAAVQVNLIPFNFPAANPTNGGVIFGNVPWPTNLTAELLGGLAYLNVHTALNPNGEIRGQLIPVNEPPVVVCPAPETVECGSPATLVALFSDPEGDPLAVVWFVNGSAVQTNSLPARAPGLPAMASLTESFPLGSNIVMVVAADTASNVVSCATSIVVVDTTPPVIVSASASPATLWPPNHKLVNVIVQAQVFDACSATTWKIVRVTSNEAVNARGSGNTEPDWIITGDHTLQLRAERSGTGNGRIYTISLQARDAAGNVSRTSTVTVTVPKSAAN